MKSIKIENGEVVSTGYFYSRKSASEKFFLVTIAVPFGISDHFPFDVICKKVRIETIEEPAVVEPPKLETPVIEAVSEPLKETEEDGRPF